MSTIQQAIMNRRSHRSFGMESIEVSKIETLIQMALYAPSPMNNQPWKFIAVINPNKLSAIHQCIRTKIEEVEALIKKDALQDFFEYKNNTLFLEQARCLILALLKPIDLKPKEHHWGISNYFDNEKKSRPDIISLGAACQNILLTAEDMNLATCIMTYPLVANAEVKDILDIRAPWEIMTYIALGYKPEDATNLPAPKRRVLNQILEIH